MSGEYDELQALAERYQRRAGPDRYSMLQPDVWLTMQERQRALLRLFASQGHTQLSHLRLVEVGCGAGGNLLELLRLGFAPERLVGIEVLADRVERARQVLPGGVTLWHGDARVAPIAPGSQDIVFVSTVFSSLLDDAFQQQLADAMWRWVAPGGGVLWYDFTVDNPRNPDVRGVSPSRVRQLFPAGPPRFKRLTLAPPLARRVARLHPVLYAVLNALPLLRTHLLAWIDKPKT
ncbi:class I SAM-dependent methyltransferase [Ideonella sp. DXS29W]|uniref:Class I SAM-dependent methyltransferase n=1 Tax=Ideonella lacteola TaxID=2984193 RepID=A0ABU9BPZ8_9BURK